jgi:anti-sigma factor RsiW
VSTECRHVRELMDSYLSEELSVETNHVVLRHVAECPMCREEIRRRQRLRALLAQALHVDVDVERARRRITVAVDREQRSWSRVARWSGVAAAVVAAVAAGYWFSRPVDASAYDDSVADHVQCALQYPASVTYDSARAVRNLRPPFQRIAEAIGLRHGAYHVIDAHMCPFNGRDYAHVVLRDGNQTVSLFIEPGARGALPPAQATTQLPGDTLVLHSTTTKGHRVSASSTSRHKLYVVSDGPSRTPEDVANQILLSAIRFVRTLER